MGVRPLQSDEALALPVTLERAKEHVRVTHEAEDALIEEYIASARAYVEGRTERAIPLQMWLLTLPGFPVQGEPMRIPKPPLVAVEAVEYVDSAGALVGLDPATYVVDADAEPAWLYLAPGCRWPATQQRPNAVRIRFRCGYAEPESIPREIIQAVLLLVGHWYINRESVVTGTIATVVPQTVDDLLDLQRVMEYG